jgi:hypothetical protein
MAAITTLKALTASPDSVPASAGDLAVAGVSSVTNAALASEDYVLSAGDLDTLLGLLGNALSINSNTVRTLLLLLR